MLKSNLKVTKMKILSVQPSTAPPGFALTAFDESLNVEVPVYFSQSLMELHSPEAGMYLIFNNEGVLCVISKAASDLLFKKPEKDPNHIEYPLMKTDRQKRIEALKQDALEGLYVVGSERDTPDPFKSRGAIVMETYLGGANLVDAVDKSNESSARGYGKTQIFKLVPVDLEEAKEAIS